MLYVDPCVIFVPTLWDKKIKNNQMRKNAGECIRHSFNTYARKKIEFIVFNDKNLSPNVN